MIKFKKKEENLAQSLVRDRDILDISIDEACRYLGKGIEEIDRLVHSREIELNLTSVCHYKFKLFHRSRMGSSH